MSGSSNFRGFISWGIRKKPHFKEMFLSSNVLDIKKFRRKLEIQRNKTSKRRITGVTTRIARASIFVEFCAGTRSYRLEEVDIEAPRGPWPNEPGSVEGPLILWWKVAIPRKVVTQGVTFGPNQKFFFNK